MPNIQIKQLETDATFFGGYFRLTNKDVVPIAIVQPVTTHGTKERIEALAVHYAINNLPGVIHEKIKDNYKTMTTVEIVYQDNVITVFATYKTNLDRLLMTAISTDDLPDNYQI